MASIHLVRAFGCGHLSHPYLACGSEGQMVGSGKNGKLKVVQRFYVFEAVQSCTQRLRQLISSCDSLLILRSRPFHSFLGIDRLLHDCKDLRLTFQKKQSHIEGSRRLQWLTSFAASPHWSQTVARFWDSSEWSLCRLTEIQCLEMPIRC